ncbi:MAG: hypothetical protein ACRCSY_07835 [Cetobacterium sp.]
MKIWEILKEENVGKEVKCSTGKEYCIDKNCNYKIGIFKNGISIDLDSTEIMTLDFEFIQQPVTFKEVLNSDKKCRVEHELIKRLFRVCESTEEVITKNVFGLIDGKWLYLHDLLIALSWKLDNKELKNVIKEGKWYLEP